MKAIQTRYKGYNFRSRIEARWAVFFDAYGVEWLYEHEGYRLSDGSSYLPDFYFPKGFHDFYFAEVKKPLSFTDNGYEPKYDYDLHKYITFAVDLWKDGKRAILLDGPPALTQYYALERNYESGEFVWNDYSFCAGDSNYTGDSYESSGSFVCSGMSRKDLAELYDMSCEYFGDHYRNSVYKALSARFEHGEKP